ncbi:hypothetical protein D1007_39324 [Hordeum vulgare]|nr:hypothetical protein D1007_39324 [Hordeum vulgare]
MRRPGPWRRPALPSGGGVGSDRLVRPAHPSAPRRFAAGTEARARAASAASSASVRRRGLWGPRGGGTAAASGRGFRRRQAVDLSRPPHFVSSVFRSGIPPPLRRL